MRNLIKIAAQLLTNKVSDNPDDYKKNIPKWLIRRIEKHNDFLRVCAIDIRKNHDEMMDMLDNVSHWETCPQEYKKRIMVLRGVDPSIGYATVTVSMSTGMKRVTTSALDARSW